MPKLGRKVLRVPTNAELGAAVREVYEGAGLTQVELAERLGTIQAKVSRWALGTSPPTVADLLRIEDACGCPRGHVLRKLGAMDGAAVTVAEAIANDPDLPDSLRAPLTAAYRAMVRAAS